MVPNTAAIGIAYAATVLNEAPKPDRAALNPAPPLAAPPAKFNPAPARAFEIPPLITFDSAGPAILVNPEMIVFIPIALLISVTLSAIKLTFSIQVPAAFTPALKPFVAVVAVARSAAVS